MDMLFSATLACFNLHSYLVFFKDAAMSLFSLQIFIQNQNRHLHTIYSHIFSFGCQPQLISNSKHLFYIR